MWSIRVMNETDQQQLNALLTDHLGEAGQSLLESHLLNPRHLPGMIQVIEQHNRLIACALVRPIRIQIGAALLECAVLTVAPADLEATMLEPLLVACFPALGDSDTTLLITQGASRSLAPLGFAAYRHQTRTVLPQLSPAGGIALRPATSADAADIAALYDATYRSLPYAERRSPADWQSWRLGGLVYVHADRLGRVLGYVQLLGKWVTEAGAADAGVARLLLAALTNELRLQGLAIPVAHPLTQVALQVGAHLSMQTAAPQQAAALAGILDLAGMLTQLLPELEQRLASSRYRGWSGTIGIALEHGPAALQFTRGAATVVHEPTASDVWLRQVSLAGLVQLLLGYRSAADLRATYELACEDTALGLLDALFPLIG